MTDSGAAPRRARRYALRALAAAGFAALVVVAVRGLQPGDDKGDPPGLAGPAPAAAPAGEAAAPLPA